MLVGSLIDFKKEIAQKKAWNPDPKVRAYCDAQYSEFRQDQFQYQKQYKALNNRTPSEYFQAAEEDAYKFIEAPKDPNDWRNFIRSGEERNKLDGLLSFLLDLNFKDEPQAVDWGGAIDDKASDIASAYLHFLNILDDSETKSPLTDFCMFTHGTVFKQIKFNVKKTLEKSAAAWEPKDDIADYKPVLRERDDYSCVNGFIMKPNRVYLADISQTSMSGQDHIWYEAVVPYATAYKMFHSWSQWQYVKPYNAIEDAWTDSSTDVETESKEIPDKVRIKWRESEVTNELSVYCNKILMTPPGLKLPEGCYSIFYQQASTLHPFFAYGRSFMDNVRPFVAVKDVLTSILVDRSRQTLEPPLKSRFRTMVNRYMFRPGAITPMQGDGDLTPLIPESAMQSFVFEALKIFDDMVNRSSISPVFQGQQGKGQMTKYEVEQQLIQSIRAVAGMVGSAAAWRRQQARLQLKVGLSHIEDITNFRFEARGKLDEIARVIELKKNVPDTRRARYEALNQLMRAAQVYKKSGTRKKFYMTSGDTLRKFSYVINYRVNPQQRSSQAADEEAVKNKIAMYRTAPTANIRAVDKLIVKMFGDEEDEMLQAEQPAMMAPSPQGAEMVPNSAMGVAPAQLGQNPNGMLPPSPVIEESDELPDFARV